MFWKKKTTVVIQCSACEWQPDGHKHWVCGCGHKWNTFKTKGKCPKCQTQHAKTRCPACGQSTLHTEWYKTPEAIAALENSGNQELRAKKKRLESRLIKYGMKNERISHLPYLDHSEEVFQSAYDAGCRMMILFAISHAAHHLDDRDDIVEWLKDEKIWNKVSPTEKDFLQTLLPEENTRMELSWRIESALTLGWCLKKVKTLPRLDARNNQKEIDELIHNIPDIGDPLMLFLSEVEYRSFDEIYEENLLNEMATSYFRDLLFSDARDTTKIDRSTSFERHKVLNWLRTSYDGHEETTGELWDDVDTST